MKNKIAYYFSTGAFSLMALGGSFMYLSMSDVVVHSFSSELVDGFNALGFPAWLIIPMGIAKLLGVVALWAPLPKLIREWAYAGFFFNSLLAIGAHVFNPINPNDTEFGGAVVALILILVSRITLHVKELK
ncbi:DoxX family protein [Sulfidibacter corallicola]|uniref:DoxX family protein n=1 Tax=Sulfidibacter corallicola TaxID=2818388 RepID=A0A8A4TGS1_SULCO|nr:DoxX family protein [Sulfidibacter corallicola]QTD48404.1 DoxX family protein [Sulfidibacter corallicola]